MTCSFCLALLRELKLLSGMALTPGWSVLQDVMKFAGARSLVFSPNSRYGMLFTVLVALSMAAAKMSLSTPPLWGPDNPERICFINLFNFDIFYL